jgi:cytosine/adenosine deaminase-related metal-dependent hydrolase
MFGPPAVTFVNSVVIDGYGRLWKSLRVRSGRVVALGGHPERNDLVVDGEQSVIVPGLINAHDHLELNSFGRLKWRPRYDNVREWIADFQPRFGTDPALAGARADTLDDRVWAGGLKNLLSGVTTVCHHNPIHPALRRRFPVRVVRQLGISHSLQVDGAAVAQSYARTPPAWPWIVHAAEGVDDEAGNEVRTLRAWGCLGANTVIVHGVAIGDEDAAHVLGHGAALVWCPSSNDFLFGQTAAVGRFSRTRRLTLGTDSRLSGAGDLLDELRLAAATRQIAHESLCRTVTSDAADILRLNGVGALSPRAAADVVMLRRCADDPYESIVCSSRQHVRLSMIGGVPLYGEPSMRPLFHHCRQRVATVAVDGQPRVLAHWVARRAASMRLREPGLDVEARW